MNCPVCNEPLIILESEQVEVDHCVSCRGVWLDSGELELLLEGLRGKNELLHSFQSVKNSQEPQKKCPICSRKMERVLCGGEIVIDRCKSGDGLWFDLGELERIVRIGSFGGSTKILEWLEHIFSKKV